MEILCPKIGPDEDEHIAQIVRLYVAVIFLVSHSLCYNHLSVILMSLTEGYRAQDEGEERERGGICGMCSYSLGADRRPFYRGCSRRDIWASIAP